MIFYEIAMAVQSSSQGGYGKLAWREWQARRTFEQGELPWGLMAKGDIFGIGIDGYECTGVERSFGYRAYEFYDGAMPIARLQFEPVITEHMYRRIGRLRCHETDAISATRLKKDLVQAGFEVIIGKPLDNQEATEHPPPAQD